MNRFLNFVIGIVSLLSLLIITEPLSGRHRGEIVQFDALNLCAHLGLIVGSILFLQFAVQRYLVPPELLTKQRRKTLMKSAETRSGNFFYGTLGGVGYLFLCFYALDLLHPPLGIHSDENWMAWSLFFFLLALISRTRAVILQLLDPQKAIQSSPQTQ